MVLSHFTLIANEVPGVGGLPPGALVKGVADAGRFPSAGQGQTVDVRGLGCLDGQELGGPVGRRGVGRALVVVVAGAPGPMEQLCGFTPFPVPSFQEFGGHRVRLESNHNILKYQ